ncbi:MAG: 16S rRNA (guanine(966)-N(2))-methyltransferase RsmD [Sulfurovum sp.]
MYKENSKEENKKKEKIKIFTTTINGGIHKGKKIEIPDIFTTRSSKGILKESLFNTLQYDIVDRNFVEVFAGSGSVGLEAISRGASGGYFIEYNKIAYNYLERNTQRVDSQKSHIFYGDSFEKFAIVYKLVKKTDQKTYFYFDPPFSTRDGMDDIYEKTVELIKTIEKDVCEMVVIEHITSLDMPKEIGELKLIKRKKFGRSSMSYYHFG